MAKRIAYLIKVRCILNGADTSARLFLPADSTDHAALDAMRKYVPKQERNSLRLLSCDVDSNQLRPQIGASPLCPHATPQCRPTGFELSAEDSENMKAEAADKAERRAKAFNFAKPVAYNDSAKRQFHSQGLARLRALAAALGLPKDSYDIRSNRGGIAVSGEITLHTNSIYVQISQPSFGGDRGILVRTCKGRKDYTGGKNNFLPLSVLRNTGVFISTVRRVIADSVWNETHSDFRGMAYDRRYILELDADTGATVLVPLESSRKVKGY